MNYLGDRTENGAVKYTDDTPQERCVKTQKKFNNLEK